MAPEILKGEAYSKKVDIYSIGILLYICVTGKFPFKDNDRKEVIKWHMNPKWDFEDEQWTNESKEFFFKLVDLDPKERYDVNLALGHPWITRNFNTKAPMTFQEIQNIFFLRNDMQQTFRSIMLINACKNSKILDEIKQKNSKKKSPEKTPKPNDSHVKKSEIFNNKVEKATRNLDYGNNMQFPEIYNYKLDKIITERKKDLQVSTYEEKKQGNFDNNQKTTEKNSTVDLNTKSVPNTKDTIKIFTNNDPPFSPYRKSTDRSVKPDLHTIRNRINATSKKSDSFDSKKNQRLHNLSNDSCDSILFTPYKKKSQINSFLNSQENERLNSSNAKDKYGRNCIGTFIQKSGFTDCKKNDMRNKKEPIRVSLIGNGGKNYKYVDNVLKDVKDLNQQKWDEKVWESLIDVREKKYSSKHIEIINKKEFQINNNKYNQRGLNPTNLPNNQKDCIKEREIKSQEDVRINSNQLVQNEVLKKIKSNKMQVIHKEMVTKFQKSVKKIYSFVETDENNPIENLKQHINNNKDIKPGQKNKVLLNKSSQNRAISTNYSKERNNFIGLAKNPKK